ncbi:N-acetylmuramoyl-L-alanine amidase [Salipiger sp. P9]|uniref:N-acetylmuramoyl-L-alanine amidase n=1 Tax=Salipiger pentaromativorans TaxID=2943193 RepID=UPI002157C238|nr:N-acetylmuramoyl-L-alanine amidase [Salipiger pentaromativorans]MCR8546678.1 N-acetylmuramoyl-L-alanine amidase [Salipiger pentaromativorans]
MGSRAVPRGARRLTPLWHPSDNFGPRRLGVRPDLVVLHYTAMECAEAARDWLCDPASNVSAHYVLGRHGTCWQLVREDMRAWHAGLGAWGSVEEVNSRSIGIEIANTGFEPFPEPQMAALETLLAGILARWGIPPDRVIGHSDMALGRKIDPGPRFDWARLARRGLAIRPQAAAPGDFHADARRFGYVFTEDQHPALLTAFRARFRPGADGPLDTADRAIMAGLAARSPAV